MKKIWWCTLCDSEAVRRGGIYACECTSHHWEPTYANPGWEQREILEESDRQEMTQHLQQTTTINEIELF